REGSSSGSRNVRAATRGRVGSRCSARSWLSSSAFILPWRRGQVNVTFTAWRAFHGLWSVRSLPGSALTWVRKSTLLESTQSMNCQELRKVRRVGCASISRRVCSVRLLPYFGVFRHEKAGKGGERE